jgi:hypothetical protein
MSLTLNHFPIVQIRFEGRRLDVALREVILDEAASDAEVKRAVAGLLGVSEGRLHDYVVRHDDTGNLTVCRNHVPAWH